GHPVALNTALKCICTGGSMALLGFPSDKVSIDLTNDVILKEITLIGVTGRKMFKTWYIAKRLLKEKRLDLTPVITHQLSLEEFDKGMELMKSGNCAKIILKP
ncbi:L-threonine 3-dehydrogenase, partial [Peptococcaceae bacterium]|nr:L-threonine 3-dehydrogenase [Peptococcaceae bacterium]